MGFLLTEEESRVAFFEHRTEKLYKAIPKPGKVSVEEEEELTMKRIY